ncbi:hypothetical protein M9Y10_032682 [Tritrichomonas musculus]|uniref:BTB domain-containing protein n=1 Tax=Tritrichomonas musculus TaxID=1915356 RepID=A0ABR2GXQ0_9EUKA
MIDQPITVIYQNESFLVDPYLLSNSSRKFQELINSSQENIQNIHLKLLNNKFTPRNVDNFLKICQNQQTDVKNSELEEILLLAQIFGADQVFNTGLNFIHQTIDPNYIVPNQTPEDLSSLILENENVQSHFQNVNLNELEFDDSCDVVQTETKEDKSDPKDNNNNQSQPPKKKLHSVFYQITSDNPFMKCPRYYIKKDNQILYMAKIKNNEIFIGPGNNFHISENKIENTAHIVRDYQGYNIVNTDDQEFKIKYLKYGDKYSMNVSFSHKGTRLNWRPKQPKNSTSYNGEFHHQPILSKKNIILQNPRNHPTFILRKMDKKMFEAECHPGVNPIIVFSVALSQILGPICV